MKIGLFGCGAYGMALSSIMSDNNNDIVMWTKFDSEKEQLEKARMNETLIPNFKISKKIKITTSVEECAKDKELLVIAIPGAFVDSLCQELKEVVSNNVHICIATKGIEQKTGLFINQIVEKYINTKNIAVISGPSFAIDIVAKKPIGLSLATKSEQTKDLVNKALRNNYLKTRSTEDIIGIEICGAIKNVIALSSGMLEGLGANESTKAMLLTEALNDMKNIIDSFGGDKKTVLSFAGFGDLLLTCTSTKSRNFSYGKLVGEKHSKEELDEYLKKTTVEGAYTVKSIYQLLKDRKISIPIIDLIHDIAINGENPEKLLTFLVEKE